MPRATTPLEATPPAATLAHDRGLPLTRWIFQPMVACSEIVRRAPKAHNGRATPVLMVAAVVAMQAVFAAGCRAVVVASAAAAVGGAKGFGSAL